MFVSLNSYMQQLTSMDGTYYANKMLTLSHRTQFFKKWGCEYAAYSESCNTHLEYISNTARLKKG